MTTTLKLYAVINSDGKFFRSKGYGGYGQSWVDDISKAKIYPTSRPAKAQITFWGKNYPEYGIPKLIEMTATVTDIIDQTDRVDKFIKDSKLKELRYEENKKKWEYEKAIKDLEKAKDKLKQFQNKS
jgi:hypothetical protein